MQRLPAAYAGQQQQQQQRASSSRPVQQQSSQRTATGAVRASAAVAADHMCRSWRASKHCARQQHCRFEHPAAHIIIEQHCRDFLSDEGCLRPLGACRFPHRTQRQLDEARAAPAQDQQQPPAAPAAPAPAAAPAAPAAELASSPPAADAWVAVAPARAATQPHKRKPASSPVRASPPSVAAFAAATAPATPSKKRGRTVTSSAGIPAHTGSFDALRSDGMELEEEETAAAATAAAPTAAASSSAAVPLSSLSFLSSPQQTPSKKAKHAVLSSAGSNKGRGKTPLAQRSLSGSFTAATTNSSAAAPRSNAAAAPLPLASPIRAASRRARCLDTHVYVLYTHLLLHLFLSAIMSAFLASSLSFSSAGHPLLGPAPLPPPPSPVHPPASALRLGTLNVGLAFQRRPPCVLTRCASLALDVAAVQEIGDPALLSTCSSYQLVYAPGPSHHQGGVGLLLSLALLPRVRCYMRPRLWPPHGRRARAQRRSSAAAGVGLHALWPGPSARRQRGA